MFGWSTDSVKISRLRQVLTLSIDGDVSQDANQECCWHLTADALFKFYSTYDSLHLVPLLL